MRISLKGKPPLPDEHCLSALVTLGLVAGSGESAQADETVTLS
jgi:hypothetical protein